MHLNVIEQPTIVLNAIAGDSGGWIEFIKGYFEAITVSKNKFHYILIVNPDLQKIIDISTNEKITVKIIPKPKSILGRIKLDFHIMCMCYRESALLYNLGNMANIFYWRRQYTRISNSIYLDPTVVNSFDGYTPDFYKRKKTLFYIQCIITSKLSSQVVVPSKFMKNLLRRSLSIADENITVITPGISSFEKFWLKRDCVTFLEKKTNEIILLDTSTYAELKNFSTLCNLIYLLREDFNLNVKLWTHTDLKIVGRNNEIVKRDTLSFERLKKIGGVKVLSQYSTKELLFQRLLQADGWISLSQSEALSYTTLDVNQFNIPKFVLDTEINHEFSDDYTFFLNIKDEAKFAKLIFTILVQNEGCALNFKAPQQSWGKYHKDMERLFKSDRFLNRLFQK